ncbi:hypothetical protein FB45DRAFT_1060618 [Roridomyces roridus]|uniref:DUF6533 domain-containing protein n=1 Tax=Roridomyces roridus TaxID=1738132 RepID=A0AAD7FIR2_9AGAR|nr:hypothetical protein FB45DRAFT_1060618 [Roridomyces roridus]
MTSVQLDAVTLAQDQHLRRCIFLAGFVVLCYDHALTLPMEVSHVWPDLSNLKRGAVWFVLVRYIALASAIVLAVYFLGDLSDEVCKRFSSAEDWLLVIQEFFVGVTLAARVCAMYGFKRRVFAALGVAAVVTVALGAYSVMGSETTLTTNVPGCHVPTSHKTALRIAAAWEAQLICDILILGLTLHRAYAFYRAAGDGVGMGALLGTMVRDGAAYFGMIGLINLANIVMLYKGDVITAGSLAWFASAISVTMICRLMLNLHDVASVKDDLSLQLPSTVDGGMTSSITLPLEALDIDEAGPQDTVGLIDTVNMDRDNRDIV